MKHILTNQTSLLSSFYIYFRSLSKCNIIILDTELNAKKNPILEHLIQNKRATHLIPLAYDGEHQKSIDFAASYHHKIFNSKNPLSGSLANILPEKDVELLGKRILAEAIFPVFYWDSWLKANKNFNANNTKIYYQHAWIANLIQKELTQLESPIRYYSPSPILTLIQSMRNLIFLCLILAKLTIAKLSKLFKKKRVKAKREYLVAGLINQWFATQQSASRSYDFLLLENESLREKWCFISTIPYRSDNRGNNIYFLGDYKSLLNNEFSDIKNKDLSINLNILWTWLLRGSWLNSVFPSYLSTFFTLIQWETILEKISFKSFVYSNAENIQQIAINSLLSLRSVRTIYYPIFIGGGFLYAKDYSEFKKHTNTLWSFLKVDYFFTTNDDATSYYRLHYQDCQNYIPVGSLFSLEQEQIKNTPRVANFEQRISQNEKKINERFVVSFFDTTFFPSDAALANYKSCYDFYQDIIKLAHELKQNYFFIVKPSKDISFFNSSKSALYDSEWGAKLQSLWSEMKATENIFMCQNRDDNAAIMAISKILITHVPSSPTLESLAAGGKSFWYESTLRHEHFIYKNVPGLHVCGYENLRESIRKLALMSEDEYQAYLKKYIFGKLLPSSQSGIPELTKEIYYE